MVKNILFFLLLALLQANGNFSVFAQEIDLSLENSLNILNKSNIDIKIAESEISAAKYEKRKMESLWYPSLNLTGAYIHFINKIEVRQSFGSLSGETGKILESLVENNSFLHGLFEKIAGIELVVPLVPRNITTLDANFKWLIFTGGRRIYSQRIGEDLVSLAHENSLQVNTSKQTELIVSYYALRLGRRIADVRHAAYITLKQHYNDAVKMQELGMIDRAERLFAEVNFKESQREMQIAENNLKVAHAALCTILTMDSATIKPISPLFINTNPPSVDFFRENVVEENHLLKKILIQQSIANKQKRIAAATYMPEIAFMAKQTIASHGIEKNLLPRAFVGVGLTWNIFDGFYRESNIAQARIGENILKLAHRSTKDKTDVGVDELYTQMLNAIKTVVTLNVTIDLCRELVRTRDAAFLEGMATSNQVIDARVMLSKVEVEMLMAYYTYDVALIKLCALCGRSQIFIELMRSGTDEDYVFSNDR